MKTADLLLMNNEQKKAFLLLKLIIFNYHGLDEEERKMLEDDAEKLNAKDELQWAFDFVNQDPLTSFERAREYFKNEVTKYDQDTRLYFIKSVWENANSKGYVTEIEAMSMLKLAKDWGVQKELLSLVRK
ncbi:MAG: hypothetical protein NZ529_09980 [Cytophagaceae bacterium]|nr:hypothetical protein [Cytophagaceae bacterium]MDW8457112.1 hypothetical protein [Cytophagaceae bacterium]